MRLSRKAWNNVIIFAAMAMILILNYSNDRMFDKKEEQQAQAKLIPEQELILTLQLNKQLIIERHGKSWQSEPQTALNNQQLDAMMMAWQESLGLILADAPDFGKQQGFSATIELTKLAQPWRLTLYPTQETLYVYIHATKQWIGLAQAASKQLLPDAIWQSKSDKTAREKNA